MNLRGPRATSALLAGLLALMPLAPGPGAHASERAAAVASLRVGVLPQADPFPAAVFNQVLGGLLGGELALAADDYRALAHSYLTLADLVAADPYRARSVTELLGRERTAAEFLGVVMRALEQRSDPSAAVLRRVVKAAAAPRRSAASSWLRVSPSAVERALEAPLSAFDLVRASALASYGESVLALEPLRVEAPGVDRAVVRVLSLGAPQIAFGPAGQDESGAWLTEVRAPQVRVQLELERRAALQQMRDAPVTVSVYHVSGGATARLRSIQCGSGGARVTVEALPGLSRIGIGRFADLAAGDEAVPAPVAELRLLGVPVVRFTASNERALRGPPQTLTFSGPFMPQRSEPSEAQTQTAGVDFRDALNVAATEFANELVVKVVRVGAVPVGFSQGAVAKEVETVTGPLLLQIPVLLTPVLQALGVNPTGADLTVLTVLSPQPGRSC